jgi:hypothetical protein
MVCTLGGGVVTTAAQSRPHVMGKDTQTDGLLSNVYTARNGLKGKIYDLRWVRHICTAFGFFSTSVYQRGGIKALEELCKCVGF